MNKIPITNKSKWYRTDNMPTACYYNSNDVDYEEYFSTSKNCTIHFHYPNGKEEGIEIMFNYCIEISEIKIIRDE
jgi:hypothetical protein